MIYAIEYYWKDDIDTLNAGFVKISEEVCEDEDDLIFYYCDSVDMLEGLKRKDNLQDFVITQFKQINL